MPNSFNPNNEQLFAKLFTATSGNAAVAGKKTERTMDLRDVPMIYASVRPEKEAAEIEYRVSRADELTRIAKQQLIDEDHARAFARLRVAAEICVRNHSFDALSYAFTLREQFGDDWLPPARDFDSAQRQSRDPEAMLRHYGRANQERQANRNLIVGIRRRLEADIQRLTQRLGYVSDRAGFEADLAELKRVGVEFTDRLYDRVKLLPPIARDPAKAPAQYDDELNLGKLTIVWWIHHVRPYRGKVRDMHRFAYALHISGIEDESNFRLLVSDLRGRIRLRMRPPEWAIGERPGRSAYLFH